MQIVKLLCYFMSQRNTIPRSFHNFHCPILLAETPCHQNLQNIHFFSSAIDTDVSDFLGWCLHKASYDVMASLEHSSSSVLSRQTSFPFQYFSSFWKIHSLGLCNYRKLLSFNGDLHNLIASLITSPFLFYFIRIFKQVKLWLHQQIVNKCPH